MLRPICLLMLCACACTLLTGDGHAQKKKPAKPTPKPIVQPAAKPAEAPPTGTLTASGLRCEYLTEPLALETRAPRLSWIVESNVRGARQTAYHILAASSAEKLAADKGDLWDTGMVAGNQTIQLEYKGLPLTARQQVFWKVRVWDQDGKAAAWSQPARWAMGLLAQADWTAQWIGAADASVEDVTAVLLRREFTLPETPVVVATAAPVANRRTVRGRRPVVVAVSKPDDLKVKRAILYATALGVYELRLNGQRVGDHILAPEFTDYHTRTQYQAYDVTALLKPGANAIGALLGDGWYAGKIGLAEILVKQARGTYGIHPRLLAQLEIELTNGQTERIVSDANWRVTREGPIRAADLLDGELYDARREMPGWDKAGFDDKAWSKADALFSVTTKLNAQPNEPIRITRELKPIAVNEPKPGVYVFDLGQNMVGWCRLQTQGAAGTTIKLVHAEMLNHDGTVYTENLRAALQTDQFILRGSGVETFEPHFTYHGFRYVQVTGLNSKPQLGDLIGRQFNSDMPETSSFETSSPLLNKLWQNILWTQRDNMHGIPTDCPQRDERMGWMGDIQIFVGTGIFNMDMGAFYTKWLRDVRDAQTPDGRFPDFAPQPFQKTLAAMKGGDFMGVAGWADAGVVVPWRLWQLYGDKRQLAENYESAKRWVEFVRQNNPDLLWKAKRGNDYGDWLNSDTMKPPPQLGIPQKGGEVPKHVFATMMFAYATDLVAKMADVLQKPDEAVKYGALFNDIRAAFNKAYVKSDGRIEGETQAGYALALHFDLLPEGKRAAAVKYMLDGIAKYKGHMSTGFHSTYRMMLELTKAGHTEAAYQLINQTSFPSWGYSIENGATTIWERWDGYVKGRGFQDKGMNSFNHYAIGAVGEWMHRVILGINNDDAKPAYEHFVIHPYPGGGLTWAKGSYNSIRGKIESSWRVEGGGFKLDVTIPANTAATVYVPAKNAESVLEGDAPASQTTGVQFVRLEGGAAVFEVQAGRYNFAVR
ncbi:MAG: glycoside hydrolase family 78 protein [Acidobacteria bacterium]|nr:glycoside hydrolase family 78 protein [Acidobacteriota bacterium]